MPWNRWQIFYAGFWMERDEIVKPLAQQSKKWYIEE